MDTEKHKPLPAIPEGRARLQTLLCFLGLLLMNLVAAIDTTALSVALPHISVDLDASFISVYYTGISFLLSWTIFQPMFASLAAISRRGTAIAALVLFMAGIIVSAVAQQSWVLIFGRTMQGMGGGGCIAMTYVLMADLFTLEKRAKFVSLLTLIYLVGTIAGPVMGGGFADKVSWVSGFVRERFATDWTQRWIFWIQVPLTAIAFVLIPVFTKSIDLPYTKKQVLAKMDWLGLLGFAVGTTLLLVVLSAGGVLWPWSNWKAPVGIAVSITILAVSFTLSYKWNTKANAMIPLMVVRDVTAAANFFGTFVQGLIVSDSGFTKRLS